MNVFNIYFENGDMYTSSGKEEGDALMKLIAMYPHLAGADIRTIEPNGVIPEPKKLPV